MMAGLRRIAFLVGAALGAVGPVGATQMRAQSMTVVTSNTGRGQGTRPTVRDIASWGQQLAQALRAAQVSSLEVRGSTQKDGPPRYIDVRQYHTTAGEVTAILLPAAEVLAHGDFTLLETHNLATHFVTFLVELPGICASELERFTISSTKLDAFYVGCTRLDSRTDPARVVRISSASLDAALRKHFPLELRTPE